MCVHRKLGLVAPLLLVVAACGRGESVRTVSGQLETGTFPGGVTTVSATRAGHAPIASRVAADGSFRLELPKGSGYRIALQSEAGKALLVSPRPDGTFTSSFNVHGGGVSDVGHVRYVGNPTLHTYSFKAPAPAPVTSECEDGVDATGAVCVDDNSEQTGSCAADGDNVECENGVDPNGQPCDDGADSTSEKAGSTTSDGDGLQCENGVDAVTGVACAEDHDSPTESAVADENLGADLGCEQEDGNESGE